MSTAQGDRTIVPRGCNLIESRFIAKWERAITEGRCHFNFDVCELLRLTLKPIATGFWDAYDSLKPALLCIED